jgi:hypothetical protein
LGFNVDVIEGEALLRKFEPEGADTLGLFARNADPENPGKCDEEEDDEWYVV